MLTDVHDAHVVCAAQSWPVLDAAQLSELWMAAWLVHTDALPVLQLPPLPAPESCPAVGVVHHVQPVLPRHVEQVKPL